MIYAYFRGPLAEFAERGFAGSPARVSMMCTGSSASPIGVDFQGEVDMVSWIFPADIDWL